MPLLLLGYFNLVDIFLVFSLLLDILNLPLKLIELNLEGVPLSLLTHLLWADELELVSAGLYQALKSRILPLLLLKDHGLLLEMRLKHKINVDEEGVDLVQNGSL